MIGWHPRLSRRGRTSYSRCMIDWNPRLQRRGQATTDECSLVGWTCNIHDFCSLVKHKTKPLCYTVPWSAVGSMSLAPSYSIHTVDISLPQNIIHCSYNHAASLTLTPTMFGIHLVIGCHDSDSLLETTPVVSGTCMLIMYRPACPK